MGSARAGEVRAPTSRLDQSCAGPSRSTRHVLVGAAASTGRAAAGLRGRPGPRAGSGVDAGSRSSDSTSPYVARPTFLTDGPGRIMTSSGWHTRSWSSMTKTSCGRWCARTLREAGYRVLAGQPRRRRRRPCWRPRRTVDRPGDLRSGDAGAGRPRGGRVDAGALPRRSPCSSSPGYPRAYLEAHHLYDPSVPMLRKPFLPSRLLESVEERLARAERDRAGPKALTRSDLPVGHHDALDPATAARSLSVIRRSVQCTRYPRVTSRR